ncbi:hypothetical protein Glove_87g193 [Diversispora epigaea]|uniref:BTB domain-containing protein n=1 Tax=Diversispora epigaea TaxID=1348612 RepID=A0A397J9N9_9GLOM|nr:hypothetical protein Glove_87g193 [Diversispora epigaea]
MSFKFFDKLSQDFSELLSDKKEYNVVIEIDKEENKKSFNAHSVVLRYRSSYFDKELENATTNENHIKTIIKPNISAQIFEIILKYIYGGIVNIEDTDTKTIYELMFNANELELKELSVKLENYLIESKAYWLKTHFSLVYRSIFNSNEFKGLKKFYNDIIVKYPNLIFESEDFISLQETALVSILERDDLNVEEIKIWDYIINWGIAQNPTLPADSKEWTKGNFKALKITLQQCLPLIRYFHIPVEVIWKKMKPYKKIFEEQLWDDIIQHSISPNEPITSLILPARIIFNPELPSALKLSSRENEPFSVIIKNDHVAELSSWIYRKSTISLANIPYEFQLILRGSRDGFHPKTFWNMCNGHAGTIVVAKVAGTDEIVGGYNPLAWDNLKSEWTKGNFKALKITLQQCLPLIRYFHIPVEVIWKKMKPYKKIFEEQLWDDIIQHSISPNEPITSLILPARIIFNPELPSALKLSSRENEPFSVIIKNDHVAELSSWIYRKSTISLANIPYEFQLILRGSRDGFHPKTFWNMCNGHAGTIVVAKVAGTDEIVGGYNPLAWDNLKSGWMKTNDSFIFSLKNGNIRNSILSRVRDDGALYYRSLADQDIYGPEFGCSEFYMKSDASDFTQDKQCSCCYADNADDQYEQPIRTTDDEFSISDYEVFKIIKKQIPIR